MSKKNIKSNVRELVAKEWRELAKCPGVRELYNIENVEDEKKFCDGPFAAVFSYMSDGPGYAGELFVLLGGEPECPPAVVIRSEGVLEVVDSTDY